MHYTTAYKSHSRTDNTLKAIEDCADYLGARCAEIVAIMRESVPTDARITDKFRAVEFMCQLVGIRGRFPVRAMMVLVMEPKFDIPAAREYNAQTMMLRKQAH